tara:strand:- start:3769 stop:4794 length:1026 start_codon:yes stop_codon:yes gene_type:complete
MEMNTPPLGRMAQTMGRMGRGGDTTLVHMTPQEVKGLASLGELTYNPVTGLPEAFNFKNILGPIAGIGGAMMGLPTWQVAGLTGLGTAVAEKDLGKGLMAGLTSFATNQLMQGLTGKDMVGKMAGTPQVAETFSQTDDIVTGMPQTFMEGVKNIQGPMNPIMADTVGKEVGMGLAAAPGGLMAASVTEDVTEAPMDIQRRTTPPRQQQQLNFQPTQPREGESTEEMVARIGSGQDRFFDMKGYAPVAEGGQLEEAFEGVVEGDGHGMEDNQMFKIKGGGLAALSPKEYVVPADVMAGLGNGNPDKGAHAMDDFISDFRTEKYGRDKQPPEMDGRKALESLT